MLKSKLAGQRWKNIFLLSFFALLGCEGDNIPNSTVLRGIPYSEDTYVERFRQSAFQHLQGKSRSDAVRFLEGDGFACENYKCQISTTYRDSAYDAVFGTNPLNRSSVLGSRYGFKNIYTINILGDHVESLQDISSNFERIETNGIANLSPLGLKVA